MLQNAGKLQKARGDSYLGADVLLLALVEEKAVQEALSEAGVTRAQLQNTVNGLRGGDMHIDSATADDNLQVRALQGAGCAPASHRPP